MNRRNIYGLFVGTAFALALLSGSASAQQKSLKDQLVGAWDLTAFERIFPDGKKAYTYGEKPKGRFVYTPDGHFVAVFLRNDLPNIASKNPGLPTPEEAKAIASGSLVYYGTYTVDEASKTINLKLVASSFPNQAPDAKRVITSMTADEIKFMNPGAADGSKIEGTLKRAPAASTK